MMNKFYLCLSCDTTEKSIQTFFCGRCEEILIPKVKSNLINSTLGRVNKKKVFICKAEDKLVSIKEK